MSGYWVQGQADGWRSRVASTLGIGQLDAACAAMVHLAQHVPTSLVGFHTEIGLGADQTEGDLDLARLVAELKKHLLISPRPVERLLGTAVRAYVTSTYVCRRPRRPSKFSR